MVVPMPGLIITNGDSAADILAAAGRRDFILPWRDVLHEGPIVAGLLQASSRIRADFLAGHLHMDHEELALSFAERDAVMRAHRDFDAIELWFEHDLYDQLQLLQVLSFFADEGRTDGLRLVQADEFLGHQRPDTILRFAAGSRPVDAAMLDFADRTWADLAMPTPEHAARGLDEPATGLPFVAPALHRFLEELPAPSSGLSRTEAGALAAVSRGVTRPDDLFRETLRLEEAPFMGDLSFFAVLDGLAGAEVPLIGGLAPPDGDPGTQRFHDARLELTPAGVDVLAGTADHVELSGVDRWWGGTRLVGRDVWRYDREAMELVPPGGAEA